LNSDGRLPWFFPNLNYFSCLFNQSCKQILPPLYNNADSFPFRRYCVHFYSILYLSGLFLKVNIEWEAVRRRNRNSFIVHEVI
jgi:hypothetical protein